MKDGANLGSKNNYTVVVEEAAMTASCRMAACWTRQDRPPLTPPAQPYWEETATATATATATGTERRRTSPLHAPLFSAAASCAAADGEQDRTRTAARGHATDRSALSRSFLPVHCHRRQSLPQLKLESSQLGAAINCLLSRRPMSTSALDRIVKGAPPPNISPEQVAAAARRSSTSSTHSITAPQPPPPSDPISSLPSSPPQIYLNLLILESSLRAQYLSLRARLRLHLLLLTALAVWSLAFTYLLFLRPREDGKGTGGSIYWVVDMGEKMGWVGGAVTWGLVWGTGVYDRGIRWPRRWVAITNRGLRGFNLKVVVMRGPMLSEAMGYLSLLDPWRWLGETKGMRYEFVPRDLDRILGDKERLRRWEAGAGHGWIEEDVAPGGDIIHLLLLPKPFSPDFREDWDTYRAAFWEKENQRRANLRKVIKVRKRTVARKEGGWLWWTGWRGWQKLRGSKAVEVEARTIREKSSLGHLKEKKRKDDLLRDGTQSRSSSRSSTPTPEPDARPRRQLGDRTSSAHGTTRKKKISGTTVAPPQPARSSRLAPSESRPTTATQSPASSRSLSKRASNLSINSSDSEALKQEQTSFTDVRIKREDNT